MTNIDIFNNFMEDDTAWEMYISGKAGTGKTTQLIALLEECDKQKIVNLTCAHTHKACKVIRDTIGQDKKISTLHSFLNKRPGINSEALIKAEVDFVMQLEVPDAKGIIFIDEYSMISADDVKDIITAQDPNYSGIPKFKVCYLGDPNQLPPVGEKVGVKPKGDYCIELLKVWRQAEDNPLMVPLNNLVDYIEGAELPVPLIANDSFQRQQDLQKVFSEVDDPVILAYTNQAVELWNETIKGRAFLAKGDEVFSPTTRELYTYNKELVIDEIRMIDLPRDRVLAIGSKYKTLEFLLTMDDVQFGKFDNKSYAFIFGHYKYKKLMEYLANQAAACNNEIQRTQKITAKLFSEQNPSHKLSRKRAKAWRTYLTIKDAVICIDFPFATTIHKAQGSTYKNVLLDCQDLSKCSNQDTLLRLWYVALSRAQEKVYTN